MFERCQPGEYRDKLRSSSIQRLAPYLNAIFLHKVKVDAMDISPITMGRASSKADIKKRKLEEEYADEERSKSTLRANMSKGSAAGKGKDIIDLDFFGEPGDIVKQEVKQSSLVQILPTAGPIDLPK